MMAMVSDGSIKMITDSGSRSNVNIYLFSLAMVVLILCQTYMANSTGEISSRDTRMTTETEEIRMTSKYKTTVQGSRGRHQSES